MTYTLDDELSCVRVTWSGCVDRDVFAAHLDRMLSDPEALACGRSLADMRDVTLDISGRALHDLLRSVVAPRLGDRHWMTAILVASDLNFGIARQFECYAEGQVRTGIFRDEASAIAWLCSEQPA